MWLTVVFSGGGHKQTTRTVAHSGGSLSHHTNWKRMLYTSTLTICVYVRLLCLFVFVYGVCGCGCVCVFSAYVCMSKWERYGCEYIYILIMHIYIYINNAYIYICWYLLLCHYIAAVFMWNWAFVRCLKLSRKSHQWLTNRLARYPLINCSAIGVCCNFHPDWMLPYIAYTSANPYCCLCF